MKTDRMLKGVRRLCAAAVGFVFFTAGILKLMDPVGTSMIVREYMNFLRLGFLSFSAGPVAESFALAETFLGIALVTGVFRKVTAWAATAFMAFFTIITLILLIVNPQMDCGCFGEAIHLTHLQSFVKNIILCVLVLAAYFPYRDFGRPKRLKYVTFALVGVAALVFAVYSLMYIPMLELTPFNLSSRLEAAAGLPDDEEDEYIATFIYEKNGQRGSFTLNHLPDSTWTFVETQTVKKERNISETGHPSLPFRDSEGNSRDTLAADGLVMAVSVPHPGRMNHKSWSRVSGILSSSAEAGFTPLLLVADDPADFSGRIDSSGLGRQEAMPIMTSVYYSDYKSLISLNRSNGGATYFNDGNLVGKWAFRSLPSERKLAKLVRADSTEVMLEADSKGRLSFQAFMLYSVALMLLF